jgi:hypothetical protein
MTATGSPAAPKVMPVKKREPGERPIDPSVAPSSKEESGAPPPSQQVRPSPQPEPGRAAPQSDARKGVELAQSVEPARGKRRTPGEMRPPAPGQETTQEAMRFNIGHKDPFRPPSEVMPVHCPPSMPLCRFDFAQLKLVGVMQVSDGSFKGLVEDPDGRGYFIASGTRIGNATVIQVNNRAVLLHDHRTRKDIPMTLSREARDIME